MPAYISPYAFILLRVGVGALAFGLFFKLFVNERIQSKRDYIDLAICGFFGVAFNMSAFFKGLSMTSAINASVLMLLSPVFVVIFSAIGYKKRIHPMVYAGIVISFVGAVLLVNGTQFAVNTGNITGDLLVMLNATSYAFYLYYVARLLKKYKAITITTFIFLFGFFYVLPVGITDLVKVEWTALPQQAIWAMVFVVGGTTILAYMLNAWGLQHSSSTLVGSYIYLQPLLATVIAIGMGVDVLTMGKALLGLLILSGLWLVNRFKS